jgi:predicted dehydrogenase
MDDFRWGILGCGRIARKWASDLVFVPGARLQAVWARDPLKAERFASEFGASRSARDLDELLGKGDLDAVYVATPNAMHRDDALSCLQHGLPVLCEKAFALDGIQARQMVQAFRERGIFLMEALWTRFLPGFRAALELSGEGRLGPIRSVEADFGFRTPFDPGSRLWDPSAGGGALLDIGLYPLFFAMEFLGPVDSFDLSWEQAPSGVDRNIEVRARHRDGGHSLSRATFDESTPCRARVGGGRGTLSFQPQFHVPTDVRLETSEGGWIVPGKCEGHGYRFEIAHVQECLARGWTESPLRPLSRTLELMDLLSRIREAMSSQSAASHPTGN